LVLAIELLEIILKTVRFEINLDRRRLVIPQDRVHDDDWVYEMPLKSLRLHFMVNVQLTMLQNGWKSGLTFDYEI
jgi:hypothetical protein